MLAEGDKLDRYVIEALIGRGGMGAVYRAHDERLDRRVALKIISADAVDGDAAQASARLLREARAAAAIAHTNAVAIYDVGEVDGRPFIAMELVRGKSLREAVSADHDWKQKLAWLTEIAKALGAAHEGGVVHRDIKPENVMIRDDGAVKVLDFGIARRAQRQIDPSAPTEAPSSLGTLTAVGVTVGTPVYMAPEQIRGDAVDGRTDQFAWGVCAYELLCGSLPWRSKGDALSLAAAILTDEPEALSNRCDVPSHVSKVVARTLQKAPDDRYPSMEDVVRALDDDVGSEDAGPETPPKARARPAPIADDRSLSTSLRRFTPDEMEEILLRAIDRQAERGDGARAVSYRELVAAARDVGVDEATLRRSVRGSDDGLSETTPGTSRWEIFGPGPFWNVRRRAELRKFLRHFAGYVVVNLVLLIMSGGLNRAVAGIWGIFVAWHAVEVLFPKEKKKKKKGKEEHDRLEEGVSELLRITTRRNRVRFATEVSPSDVGEEEREELAAEEAHHEVEKAEPRRRSP